MSHEITRREFLGSTAALAASLAVSKLGSAVAQGGAAKSRVVKAVRTDACANLQPNTAVVKEMVNAAVMRLAGKRTAAKAWATFVKPNDVVGIKINTLFGLGASTRPEVTTAVIEGCLAAGVPADKIIVWDRADQHLEKSGYRVNRGTGVKCYGVNNDWEGQPVAIHTCQGRLATVLTQTCTALINVPILKSHGTSGITMAMKNHYGSFHNPNEAHGNNCDPFLAHLNNLPPIKDKTRLIIGDALLPVADGGPGARPQWTWENKTILAATDPVAMDYVALQLLDQQRAKLGKPSLEATGQAKHVFTAAQMGLGVADMSKIELVEA